MFMSRRAFCAHASLSLPLTARSCRPVSNLARASLLARLQHRCSRPERAYSSSPDISSLDSFFGHSGLSARQWFASVDMKFKNIKTEEKESQIEQVLDWTLRRAKEGDSEMLAVMGILASANASTLPQAVDWFLKASELNHPFSTYALGVLRLTGSSEAIIDPENGLSDIEVGSSGTGYYIDLDNLDGFLGAASSNANGEPTNVKQFNFEKWLKKQSKKSKLSKASLKDDSVIARNVEEGLLLLEKASKLNSVEAMITLAFYFLEPDHKDDAQALKYLRMASDLNATFAMYKIAQMLFEEDERAQESDGKLIAHVEALNMETNWFSWFKRAADGGHTVASFWVGYFLHQGPAAAPSSRLVRLERDDDGAINYLLKSHAGGYKQATYYLSHLYRDESSKFADPKKAVEFLELAALGEAPVSDALFELADSYLNGLDGKTQDDSMALELFKAAGKLGHAEALCNVGAMYFNGRGDDQDYEKAFYAYQNAALHGNIDAHRNLANMYEQGLGVPKSEKAAKYHLNKAANKDSHHAMLDALEEAHIERIGNANISAIKKEDL